MNLNAAEITMNGKTYVAQKEIKPNECFGCDLDDLCDCNIMSECRGIIYKEKEINK